jgi:stress response protein SCP2
MFADLDGLKVALEIDAHGMTIDYSCFGVDAAGKLSDDRYMIFYNQKESPEKALQLRDVSSGGALFALRLNALAATVDRLVFTAAIDGAGAMNAIGNGSLEIRGEHGEKVCFAFSGVSFAGEKALIIGELYRKDGVWRFAAVGQGFNGGLAALLKHFGGEEQPDGAPASPVPLAEATPPSNRISLDKIQKEAPRLVELVKKVNVSLAKVGLTDHTAKVALCLDISASMDGLYRKGLVQGLADRVLALATRFDDDGEVDVFLFGENGHHPNPLRLEGSQEYIRRLLARYPLEGGTRYHKAMQLIREFYFGGAGERKKPLKSSIPVYVMFITDGGTSNRESCVKQVQASSYEPLFWQFMAIGKSSRDVKGGKKKWSLLSSGNEFEFLEKLDELEGRHIDNANFFSVENPLDIEDEQLYDLMMAEYPQWLKLAREKGVLG